MDFVVRAIEESELPAFARADAAGFGEDAAQFEKLQGVWMAEDLDRTRAALEGDEIVGTSRNHSFELTLPGGAQIPAAGVSAVAVLPTHTRRGVLRAMMAALFDETREREEAVSMLTASQGAIYQRFGFGVSTFGQSISVDTRAAEFVAPRPEGRTTLVEPEVLRKHAPEVFDSVRAAAPGALSRSSAWWVDNQFDRQTKQPRFDVLWESADGVVDGFVTYSIKPDWGRDPSHVLTVRDLVGRTPDAVHGLWRYVCEVDLVATVRDFRTQVDSVLPWLLVSPRAVHTTSIDDYVWTRLLDVPAALGRRTYASTGRVVIEVHDPSFPGEAADGVFALDGGPEGADVTRTADSADLECDIVTLSAVWLGGVAWSTLAAAGLVREHTSGALATADAMFASTPLPFPYTWF